MQKEQKLLRKSKAARAIEVFSPRTTASNIQKNDSRLLNRIILKLTKPTIVKLKHEFKQNKDEIDFITFAKLMGKQLVGWQPNIPNRRYQMIRCLYKLFNQIDYLNKGKLKWDQVINFIAQRPLNPNDQKVSRNSLKTFTQVKLTNKYKFQNQLIKVVYVNSIDKLAILEESSNKVKFIDSNNGELWNKQILINPKKLIVNISSLKKTKGEYRKKELELISSVRILDILYIHNKYKVLLTSSSDRYIRGWRYNNNNFVLSNDFTDQQFLFEKQFPQNIYSMEWDELNQILFCGSEKGKLFYYNIQLDLKNEMSLDEKEGHTDIINTMIVVPKLHFVVTGGMDGKVLLWDTQTFKLKQIYNEHTRSISCLAYHPDLILVFSAGFDTNICVWNPYTSNIIFKIINHSTAITTMSILPNTNFLISISSQGVMKITQLNKFKTLNSISLNMDEQFHLKPQNMTIIPNKLRLCIVGRSVQMFDYDKTYNPVNCDDDITISAKYSVKKFEIYTVSHNRIKIWNTLTGNIQVIYEHEEEITSFVIDKYEKCFIVGDIKGNISLYNISNGYKVSTIFKTESGTNSNTSTSSIYMLTSIINGDEWLVLAVNQQNSIFVFKQVYGVLTYIKTLKIPPHTNIKSIIHLIQHKLICAATDSNGLYIYQFDSLNKIQHFELFQIVSIQQIIKNIIQITFISGEIKFYYSPPSVKLSPMYEFQHKNQIIRQSLYSLGRNYVCDERGEVSCYDYNQFIQTIQEERYKFENIKIQCLWTIKVTNESIKEMILIPEWQLFIICSEDKEVKLWSIEGKYIDSLKQNYHKNEPVILMRQTRKTILELQNKYQQYDPYFHYGVNTVSNSEWNLFLEFRSKFEQQHKMFYSLLKQLNKQVEQDNIHKQNEKRKPISLQRIEDTKNRSINLLMKSVHENACDRGLSDSKYQNRQQRQPAQSTFVPSNYQRCNKKNTNTSVLSLFPQTMLKTKESIETFKSLHMTRQFPCKMHKNQKNAFKIHFQTRLDPCQKALHNQSIQRLSSTFLKSKISVYEPPKIFMNNQEALAAQKLNQAFETTQNSFYRSGKIFKNIVVRKSVSHVKLNKTLSKLRLQ